MAICEIVSSFLFNNELKQNENIIFLETGISSMPTIGGTVAFKFIAIIERFKLHVNIH